MTKAWRSKIEDGIEEAGWVQTETLDSLEKAAGLVKAILRSLEVGTLPSCLRPPPIAPCWTWGREDLEGVGPGLKVSAGSFCGTITPGLFLVSPGQPLSLKSFLSHCPAGPP